jgi:hypothetical protein
MGLRPTGDLGALTFYTATNGALVYFAKAPPLSPASPLQLLHRNRFRLAGKAWTRLAPDVRDRWEQATKKAALRINGYQLWVHWTLSQNRATIRTIERQTNVTLLEYS